MAPAAVFVLLWFIATFYLWGDLGKWCDDWGFNFRDPVTGGIRPGRLFGLDPWDVAFWRPLHIRFGAGLQTLLWNHDWAIHLIMAALHGVNAWLVWKVLGRMCSSLQAPALGALAFLCYPAGHEAVFWMSTLGSSAGTCFFLLCTLGVLRYGAGEIGARGLLAHLPLLITLGWWYEQPAAAGPALALAYLAVADPGRPVRARLARAAAIGAGAGAAGLLYAVIFVALARPSSRGGVDTLVTLAELPGHALVVWRHSVAVFLLEQFQRGAIAEGWRTYWAKPYQGAVVAALLAVAFLGFGRWWMSGSGCAELGERTTDDGGARTPLGRLAGLGFGVAILAASYVPVLAVTDQGFAPRMAYVPAMGLAIALGMLADWPLTGRIGRSPPGPRWPARALALAALATAVLCGALMLLGVQSVWWHRDRQDRAVVRQLRGLVPDPPRDGLFVPVDVRGWPLKTPGGRFERLLTGPFETSWTAEPFVQWAYGRRDVHSLTFNRWLPPSQGFGREISATPDALVLPPKRFYGTIYPTDAAGNSLIGWDRIVAFTIDQRGRVRLVDAFEIEDPSGLREDFTVRLGPERGAGEAGARPRAVKMAVSSGAGPVRSEAVSWSLVDADAGLRPADLSMVGVFGEVIEAFSMHPAAGPVQDRAELVATLPPSATARRLVWRLGVAEYIWSPRKPLSDGLGVSVRADGAAEPLWQRQVTPRDLRRHDGRIRMGADIPPCPTPLKVRLRIDAGERGDAATDWCFVTPPVLVETAEVEAAP